MNCPTCQGPIIDGLCCNGTPKECLQKWWNEHGLEPRPICTEEEFKADYRDFIAGFPFQSFREHLAAIEARAQATDALLTAQTEAIELAEKLARQHHEQLAALQAGFLSLNATVEQLRYVPGRAHFPA